MTNKNDIERESDNESDQVGNDYPDEPSTFEKAMLWVLIAVVLAGLFATLLLHPR